MIADDDKIRSLSMASILDQPSNISMKIIFASVNKTDVNGMGLIVNES